MIFVTVGTHTLGLDRLVQAMDSVAAGLDDEVVMQIGSTPFKPQHARYFDFAPMDEMERWCAAASLIISHAGAGSILTAQKFDKPLLLVPRLRKFGEVIDDHQLELALALEATGQAVAVQDVAQLASALKLARQCHWDTNKRKAALVAELRAVATLRASRQPSQSPAAKPR